ncbi:hypothetical protein B0A48_14255 [Cryoendolithus antarcticus]|uniref:Uncharacterized protein n=1 Tax=Cryoendolithus antarcticus TaxID=1507870 RepID=A0A1V8SME5_9PEZI|nr:hypothetical protein B0A48_14255 [Cryoendolithus antarcticus]
MALRFQDWFTLSEQDFGKVSSSTCNASLAAFRDAYARAPSQAAIGLGINTHTDPVYELCQSHASCILENSSEWTKANLSTSSLVLGLLPTILAVVAPSMTEMAVLGVHRPLLAAILSISTPAILQARVFSYEDPGDILLTEHPRGDIRHPLILGPWSARTAITTGIVEIVLTVGVLLNTLTLVTQLTNNSVLSWGCTRTWPVYVWMFVPFIIHALATTGYHLTLHAHQTATDTGHQIKPSSASDEGVMMHDMGPDSKAGSNGYVKPLYAQDPMAASSRNENVLRRRLHQEITSCASHAHPSRNTRPHVEQDRRMRTGILLNSIAGFLGFMHLVFGTATFSALLFIVPKDAIGQIAMRLMLSALVCRFLVMFELAGLRGRALQEKIGNKQGKESLLGNAA